jgi:hypothetical protein
MTAQSINHLVIQCGEHHAPSVCKILSEFFLASNACIFLPHNVAGSLPTETVAKYYTAHKDHMKNLRMIGLLPIVTSLDKARDEFLPDGSTLRHTPREWAMALTISTGQNARCDIVNGGSGRLAYLLVPRQFNDEISAAAPQYKMRSSPLEQRKVHFRDAIPGLPTVIQVDTSVQAALDRLELLSSEEVSKRAPSAVREAVSTSPLSPGTPAAPPVPPARRPSASVTSNLTHSSDSNCSQEVDSRKKCGRKRCGKPKARESKASRNPQEDASTHSVTSSVASKRNQQY